MFKIGNWIRPDDGMMGDNFKRIIEKRTAKNKNLYVEDPYEYKVECYWDWEENLWVDPPQIYWPDMEIIEFWTEYTERELIESLFVGGVYVH